MGQTASKYDINEYSSNEYPNEYRSLNGSNNKNSYRLLATNLPLHHSSSGDLSAQTIRKRRSSSAGSDEWFQDDIEVFDRNDAVTDAHTNSSLLVPLPYHVPKAYNNPLSTSHPVDNSTGTGTFSRSYKYYHEKQLQIMNTHITTLLTLLPPSVVTPPEYILESTLSSQYLWYLTAGQRMPQPNEVKLLIEQLWQSNIEKSQCEYVNNSANININTNANNARLNDGSIPMGGNTEKSAFPASDLLNSDYFESDSNIQVLYTNPGIYSSIVSKSFNLVTTNMKESRKFKHDHSMIPAVTSFSLAVTIQIPKYRVVQDLYNINNCTSGHNTSYHSLMLPTNCCRSRQYAEYLVIISLGDSHQPITLGVWKRYSEFAALATKVF